MIKIKPIQRQNIIKVFGQPADTSQFIKVPFPFGLRTSWNYATVRTFYGHEYIADAVVDALKSIQEYYGYQWIRENDLDLYGGCFVDRNVRGGAHKSVHAWGLAIDYVPHLGQLGKPSMLPYHCVKAFTDRGFMWGGDWKRQDGQHFSAIVE